MTHPLRGCFFFAATEFADGAVAAKCSLAPDIIYKIPSSDRKMNRNNSVESHQLEQFVGGELVADDSARL